MFPEGRIVDFLIVGVGALIVVGPKDLPILMRKVGEFMARMRAMAAEFRASFDEMARQSELDELRREVDALRSGAPTSTLGLDRDLGVRKVFDEIDHGLREAPAAAADYGYPARLTPAETSSDGPVSPPSDAGEGPAAPLSGVMTKAPT